jgi:hypothetical protein
MKLASFKGIRPGLAGLFSIGCKWWLGGPYTHTELIFSDGWAGTSRATEGGVVLHKIDYSASDWDIVEIEGDEANARAWYEAHRGAKFDYLGLIGFVWSRGTNVNQRWFCSESVAAALGFDQPYRFDPCSLPVVLTHQNEE